MNFYLESTMIFTKLYKNIFQLIISLQVFTVFVVHNSPQSTFTICSFYDLLFCFTLYFKIAYFCVDHHDNLKHDSMIAGMCGVDYSIFKQRTYTIDMACHAILTHMLHVFIRHRDKHVTFTK